MKLHNMCKITYKGKQYISYNTMLSPVYSAISQLTDYNSRIAVGVGTSATTSAMTTLENFSYIFDAVTDSYNFDLSEGDIFVTKKVVLGTEDDREISFSELGIAIEGLPNSGGSDSGDGENSGGSGDGANSGGSGDGDGENSGGSGGAQTQSPRIANRFLVYDLNNSVANLLREPYEELEISITLFLDYDSENSTLYATAGNNPLFAQILGEAYTPANKKVFALARSNNTTASTTLVDRSSFLGNSSSATVSFSVDETTGTLNATISGNLGAGVVEEFLLLYGETPVMRLNVSENNSISTGLTSNFSANDNGAVEIQLSGIEGITAVYDNTANQSVTTYGVFDYGKSFSNVNLSPFGNVSFNNSTTRVYEKNGKSIGFVQNGQIYVYSIVNGTITAHNMSGVVTSGVTDWYLSGDYVLGYNSALVRKSYAPYQYVSGAYVSAPISLTTSMARPQSYGEAYMYSDQTKLVIFSVNASDATQALKFCRCNRGNTNFSTIGTSLTSMLAPIGCFVVNSTNINSDLAFVFSSTKVYKTVDMQTYTEISDQTIKDFFLDINRVEGYPKSGVRGLFKKTINNGAVEMEIFDTNNDAIVCLEGGAGCTDMYFSRDFKYVARKTATGFSFSHFTTSNTEVAFANSLPQAIDQSKILDIDFMDGCVLLFMNDTVNPIIKVDIDESFYGVDNLTPNNSITITYDRDTTVGADGNNVSATAELEIACTNS